MQFPVVILIFVSIFNSDVIARPPSKIIKGQAVSIRNAPYVVRVAVDFLLDDPEGELCTGTIIMSRHILTVAHCFDGMESEWEFRALRVVPGTHDYQRNPVAYEVQDIRVHPLYQVSNSEFLDADIAVVQLKEPIPVTANEAAIKMARTYAPQSSQGTIFGWGRLTANGANSPTLQKLDVVLWSHSECTVNAPNHRWRNDELCVHSLPSTGPCVGDSGGPVIVNDTLTGIVTSIEECGSPVPAGVISVTRHIDWIDNAVDGRGDRVIYSARPQRYFQYDVVTTPRPTNSRTSCELPNKRIELTNYVPLRM